MGIKGFYGYCTREIKECHRTVNILEEIAKYRSQSGDDPLIIINLSTLSYHFKLKSKDLLCGYQLNKIKFEFENFLAQLKNSGANLEFVFKKAVADDKEFLRRRLRDYHIGCEIMEKIEKVEVFEKLETIYKRCEKFPYNTLILVAIIQSAAKFGPVHGCNSIKGKPTVQQVALARQKGAAVIMGLDTSYFLMPGEWKIWCDSELDMSSMTVQELDVNIVMSHFELKPEQGPLFASLVGDLQASFQVTNKVAQHFGTRSLFPNAAKFIRRLTTTTTDDIIQEVVSKIFGDKGDPIINECFKLTFDMFTVNNDVETNVDMDLLELVKDDFVSIAEEILLNTPIFINPAFSDMTKKDMKPFNDLVLPFIQKTAGLLLKNLDDSSPRKVVLLKRHDGKFKTIKVDPIFPDFEVPALHPLISGGASTNDKNRILHWITGMRFNAFELTVIPEVYLVDCIILLYLVKHESLDIVDARCILKTLVDANLQVVPLEPSTEYPERINERALRCSFLYSKVYFMLHSCLSSLGMKHLCPEIKFDGVYFQKIYALNCLEDDGIDEKTGDQAEDLAEEVEVEENNNKVEVEENNNKVEAPVAAKKVEYTGMIQTQLIDDFAMIIRMTQTPED